MLTAEAMAVQCVSDASSTYGLFVPSLWCLLWLAQTGVWHRSTHRHADTRTMWHACTLSWGAIFKWWGYEQSLARNITHWARKLSCFLSEIWVLPQARVLWVTQCLPVFLFPWLLGWTQLGSFCVLLCAKFLTDCFPLGKWAWQYASINKS